MTEEIRRSKWHEATDIKVNVPVPIVQLIIDRKVAKVQTTVKSTPIGSGRFQIDQRSAEGVGLRTIVLEFTSDEKTQAQVNGYTVLMSQVDKDWFPEEVQFALDEIAKEVIIPPD